MTSAFSTVFPASWRGVPFAVIAGDRQIGRRKALHDYPYRDGVYIEDLGRRGRQVRLQGFLLSNSKVYGGGDVLQQAAALENACEQEGPGLLVHPTRGPMLVDLVEPLVLNERWEHGQYFEFTVTFMEGLSQAFPAVQSSLSGLVSTGVSRLNTGAASDFTGSIGGQLSAAGVGALGNTAQAWSGQVQGLVGDASVVMNAVSLLGGAAFGRYFNGANAGFQQTLATPFAGADTVDALIGQFSVQRQAVATAAAALQAATDGFGATATASDVAAAATGLVDAFQAATANPADGVRLSLALAAWDPGTVTSATPAGEAFSALMRRSALAAAVTSASAYAPSSADDAAAVRDQLVAAIDAEILVAGDTFDDASFEALRGLRQATFTDLGQRGAALPSMTTVQSPSALPAAVLAQRLYQDATRRDELVFEADPVNPLFMPRTFRALSA